PWRRLPRSEIGMSPSGPESLSSREQLAARLIFLRTSLDGPMGARAFSQRICVTVDEWYAYEAGAPVPAEVLIRVIEVTHASPEWLAQGTGPRFRAIQSGE